MENTNCFFKLSDGLASDVGPSTISTPENGALTAAETVSIAIRNFGTDPQTSIPLELRVDGVLVASETFNGTIASNELGMFTFAQTVDLSTVGQTYTLEVTTLLPIDEFSPNNVFSKEVKHLFTNDIGAVEVSSPEGGSGLGLETISVHLENFGVTAQSGFDVQYVVNGGAPVIETFTGTINSQGEVLYDFATPFDFSDLGVYTIVVSTTLTDDLDASNDTVTLEVEHIFCMPNLDCSFGDGFTLVQIAEINNPSECEGYGDFTAQIANLSQGSENNITFTTGYGDQNVKVWIDFNDDFSFTTDEIVVPNYVIASGSAQGNFTETTTLAVPATATLGEHIMRVKSSWQEEVDNDACAESEYGETEDYTANIGVLGIEDFEISNGELTVTTLADKQFEVFLTTQFKGNVCLGVYTVLGQEMGFEKSLSWENGVYKMNLDMSNVSSGVYILKIGGQTTTSYKTARIIVQ